METRFLIKEGQTRTLLSRRGAAVVGIEREPVCVTGRESPLPTTT
jgi:3-polyprenyl-4-hydroxybenzoate decarboxylase